MNRITTVAFLAAVVASASGCSKKSNKAADVAAPEQPAATDTTTSDAVAKDTQPNAADANQANLNNTVFFEFDSSTLSADARAKLDENAEWLRQDAKREVTVEGHTDEVGTPEYNLALGDRRARAAKEYLTNLGIAADRVDVITYGEERPASTEDAQNRRSVFIATQKGQKNAAVK
jgi:peptidoglycan-associated lipoprotein